MATNGNPRQDPYIEHLDFLLSSFTDNGKSLRGFTIDPQELAITMLTAGLLSNSKLLISPEDACLLYTSPSPRDLSTSRMPSSA